ncbi:hypothetical protein ACFLWU_06545, partial [Chloroflexota bacterium]
MEAGSRWYNRIVTEIGQYQTTLNAKDAKKYKLDLLLRIAGRINEFSDICGECQMMQQEISILVQEMSLLIQMPSRQGTKNHAR